FSWNPPQSGRQWGGGRLPVSSVEQLSAVKWSGLRESNPYRRLGKPLHYHCAKPARDDSTLEIGDARYSIPWRYSPASIKNITLGSVQRPRHVSPPTAPWLSLRG